MNGRCNVKGGLNRCNTYAADQSQMTAGRLKSICFKNVVNRLLESSDGQSLPTKVNSCGMRKRRVSERECVCVQ